MPVNKKKVIKKEAIGKSEIGSSTWSFFQEFHSLPQQVFASILKFRYSPFVKLYLCATLDLRFQRNFLIVLTAAVGSPFKIEFPGKLQRFQALVGRFPQRSRWPLPIKPQVEYNVNIHLFRNMYSS